MIKVAILVDGGFYRKRAAHLFGEKSAVDRAEELEKYCRLHLKNKEPEENYLYRVFYYDCPPSDKNIYHPYLQNNVSMKNEMYLWMTDFLNQ